MADTCIPMHRDSIIIAVWYEYGYLLKTGIIGPRGYHNPDRVACRIQTVQSVAAIQAFFWKGWLIKTCAGIPAGQEGEDRDPECSGEKQGGVTARSVALPGAHHQVQCAFMLYLRSTSFEVSLNSLRSRRSRYIL